MAARLSIVSTRLVTIYPQGDVSVSIKRWNTTNTYTPKPASLCRLMMLIGDKYPVIRLEFNFPKAIKEGAKIPEHSGETMTVWIGGYPREVKI
jgi:hypothetical protein